MGERTIIAWADHTFNHVIGCSKVHAGCANCYAEADFGIKKQRVKWGPNGTRSKTSDSNWRLPLKWNRDAERAGERRRVFCASLADVFEDWQGPIVDHNGVPLRTVCPGQEFQPEDEHNKQLGHRTTMDDLRVNLFKIIDATPWLTWMLLTKRPENIRKMWPALSVQKTEPVGDEEWRHWSTLPRRENCWLGTSVSNQETHDRQWPELAKCRDLSPVLFFSGEPLLAPITLDLSFGVRPDWVIIGGESGPNHRPMDHQWARDIRDQCKAAGVAFFFKQSSAARTEMGIELDGQIIREFPQPERAMS